MAPKYTAVIQQHGDWWIGWIEEVPGVNSQGKTREELLGNLKDALDEAIELENTGIHDAKVKVVKKPETSITQLDTKIQVATPDNDALFAERLARIEKLDRVPIEKPAQETEHESIFRSKLNMLDNALRDGRGRLVIFLLIVAVFGFLWGGAVGMPNPLFGSAEWILKRGKTERVVDPQLWYISATVETCWITSWFTMGGLIITASDRRCMNPKSNSYLVPFILILNASFVVVVIGWIIGGALHDR
jgi:predicted RNase H-like HicB family nuclease